MKSNIHPKFKTTKYICSCGNIIETSSTMGGEVKIEICSACHPFYEAILLRSLNVVIKKIEFAKYVKKCLKI